MFSFIFIYLSMPDSFAGGRIWWEVLLVYIFRELIASLSLLSRANTHQQSEVCFQRTGIMSSIYCLLQCIDWNGTISSITIFLLKSLRWQQYATFHLPMNKVFFTAWFTVMAKILLLDLSYTSAFQNSRVLITN